jgi:hypothetical protein
MPRLLFAVFLLSLAGCSGGVVTHPVQGQVQLDSGDATALAGHVVEAALQSDPQVRASGEIQSDGSFVLHTHDGGVIRRGAAAGSYLVLIVLSDDDQVRRRLAAHAIHARFLRFDQSGLSLQVPAAETASLKLSRR